MFIWISLLPKTFIYWILLRCSVEFYDVLMKELFWNNRKIALFINNFLKYLETHLYQITALETSPLNCLRDEMIKSSIKLSVSSC